MPDEILQAAIADAAQQTGVDPSTITVVSAEATTWNNGALGCPKPGEMYTQALVPGYQIVLEAGGRELDYHASESGTVKLCEGLPRELARERARGRQAGSLSTSSRTAAADASKATRSSGVSVISNTRSSPPRPSTTGTPTNRPSTPNSPLQLDRAREDALPVAQDGVDHLERRRGRGVERRAGLEQRDDLGAAVRGPLLERAHALGGQELGDGHAGDGRVARQRHHRVAVAAEHEGVDVLDRHAHLLRDERPEARGVEDAGHAQDALAREARGLHRDVAHRVERVGDDDQDRVGRRRGRLADDAPRRCRRSWPAGRRGSCPAGGRGRRSRR